MKRWTLGLLVVCCAIVAGAAQLKAGENAQKNRRQRVEYPPRYTRASMSWNYVFRDRYGKVKVRQVYPGYADHFPPPAYLYYGYPKSGDFTGMGIGGSP